MPCTQHPFKRSRKEYSTEAPYCRKENWWKSPDNESEEKTSVHRHVTKMSSYVLPPKGKTWSIVWFASGLKSLKKAEKHLRSAKLDEEFNKLVKQWKEETFFLSSLSKMFAHPAYQRIMAMGTDGLSLVLGELQNGQGNWFYALKFMAGKDVAAGIKNYEAARAAWLEWGYKNNYI